MSKFINNIQKLSLVKKILLAFGSLILLALSSWLYIYLQLWQVYDVNRNTVENILTNLAQENYKEAYALFADEYKKEENFDTFKQNVSSIKVAFLNYKANSYRPTKTTRFLLPLDPPSLRYIGTISYQDGSKAEITAIFIWENNSWKLYLLEFN